MRFNRNYIKAFHEIPPTSLENYRIIKLIGKGAFATVSLGVHKLSGKYVAIKTIDKRRMKNSGAKMKVLQEVLIQKRMHHPSVIRYMAAHDEVDCTRSSKLSAICTSSWSTHPTATSLNTSRRRANSTLPRRGICLGKSCTDWRTSTAAGSSTAI